VFHRTWSSSQMQLKECTQKGPTEIEETKQVEGRSSGRRGICKEWKHQNPKRRGSRKKRKIGSTAAFLRKGKDRQRKEGRLRAFQQEKRLQKSRRAAEDGTKKKGGRGVEFQRHLKRENRREILCRTGVMQLRSYIGKDIRET